MAGQISNDFNAFLQSVSHSDLLMRTDNERTTANRTPAEIERAKTNQFPAYCCLQLRGGATVLKVGVQIF